MNIRIFRVLFFGRTQFVPTFYWIRTSIYPKKQYGRGFSLPLDFTKADFVRRHLPTALFVVEEFLVEFAVVAATG